MKYLRWVAQSFLVFACMTILSPLTSSDVLSAASHTKKSVSASQGTSKKKPLKKPIAKKTVTKKTTVKTVARDDDPERRIWLKRAKESETLTGKASWYGRDFHNKATASGLTYDMHTFTAAHRTLPMGTVVKVTDQNNGKSVMVCVTDRGPYVKGRIIDLSYAAAKQLGLDSRGVGKVKLEVVSDTSGTPLKSNQAYYVHYASTNGKTSVGPFNAFADASAMREALSQAHPEAEVVLDNAAK